MKKIFAAILCSLLLTGGIVAQAMAPMALGGSLNLSFMEQLQCVRHLVEAIPPQIM